jgi:acyl carrier protein
MQQTETDKSAMNDFLSKIAAILEADEVKTTDDLKSFPQWDSLSVLSVIAMLDATYGVNLKAIDLGTINSVGELWELVQSKQPA